MKRSKLLTLSALTALLFVMVLMFAVCGCSDSDKVDVSQKAGEKIVKSEKAEKAEKTEKAEKDGKDEKDSKSSDDSENTSDEDLLPDLQSDENAAKDEAKKETKSESKESKSTSVSTSDEAKGDNTYTPEQLSQANTFMEQETSDSLQPTVPEGMPAPVDNAEVDKTVHYTCTLSITCHNIFDNMDKFDSAKSSALPEDGVVYATKELQFSEGETAFDVLCRECMKDGIQLDYNGNPLYNASYIKGIHNLYDYDCGELSGWMYSVNGWFPNYGCSRYVLKDGDVIRFEYTCDLGEDLGVTWME